MKKPSKSLRQPNWIIPEAFEFICFNLTKKFLEYGEPIPDYSTKDTALLESSLASPRQTYELVGAPLTKLAAILFYSLIKNHPFPNGNKRIAVMTLLIFLSINGKWLEVSPYTLYEIAILVAESEAKERDYVIHQVKSILDENIVEIPF